MEISEPGFSSRKCSVLMWNLKRASHARSGNMGFVVRDMHKLNCTARFSAAVCGADQLRGFMPTQHITGMCKRMDWAGAAGTLLFNQPKGPLRPASPHSVAPGAGVAQARVRTIFSGSP